MDEKEYKMAQHDAQVGVNQNDINNQANAHAVKVAAKGVANYFTGGKGGKVVDIASKTKAGQALLDKGGKVVTKINKHMPMGNMAQKALNKAEESGVTGAADNAMDMMGGPKKSGAPTNGATPNTGATNGINPANGANPNGGANTPKPDNASNTSSSSNPSGAKPNVGNPASALKNKLNPLNKLGPKSLKESKDQFVKKMIRRKLIAPAMPVILIGAGFLLLCMLFLIAIGPNAGATMDLTSGTNAGSNFTSSGGGIPYTAEEIEQMLIYDGDSRTVGMKSALSKDSIGFIGEVNMGYSYCSTTANTELETMLTADSKKIVVLAYGVNDLGNIDQYINYYNSISSKFSNTKFYFMSVNPINNDLAKKNGYKVTDEDVVAFNDKLSNALGESYIDVYSEIKSSFVATDGIHYDGNTYIAIHNAVISYLQSKNTKGGGAITLDEYPLEGENTEVLRDRSLEDAIGADGIEEVNNSIKSSVEAAGRCTGNAVAAAGLNLVYGLQQRGVRVSYYWGGGHGAVSDGVKPGWGLKVGTSCSNSAKCYYHDGLDCSGFVSWAITNAGVPFAGTTVTFMSTGKVISFEEAKAGDLLCNNHHVILIIENKGDYLVTAESTGGTKGTIFRHYDKAKASNYSVLDLTEYYESHCS